MRITDLSPHQRPRERLMAGLGEELGDAELLALLWGSGIRGTSAVELGQRILSACGGLSGLLRLGLKDWAGYPGIGPAKAGQLWASLELARRAGRGQDPLRLLSPQAAGTYLLARCQGWTEERFGLLALNSQGALIADRILSQGLSNATLVSPREFYREALRYGAVTAIAYHNHPGGGVTPSREDIALTRRLRESGKTLGVPLADHLILGAATFHSFRTQEGWGQDGAG